MSDLKIIVVDTSDKKKQQRHEIFCHKMILCARSEYFRAMYSVSEALSDTCQSDSHSPQAGFKESTNTELVIDDCSYEG